MKRIVYSIHLILLLNVAYGQSDCNLLRYNSLINEGDRYFQSDDYESAMKSYNAAMTACKEKIVEVQKKTQAVFVKINQLKSAADLAKADALMQRQIAIDAFRKADYMQQKVETAMIDKAIKEHFPGWKSFAKYSSSDSTQYKILDHIDSLDLSDNALLRIPNEVTRCPNLKYINLLGNTVFDWGASQSTLNKLNDKLEIYISVNDLSEIDSSYWHFITGLEILPHKTNSISQNILKQKQLRYLKLDENELEELPPEIGTLTNLRKLSLHQNKLRILPVEIGNLINLTQLELQDNQLAALPPEIGRLKDLTVLDLDNNLINTLPVEIGSLTKLNALYIDNNNLSTLPYELGGLKNLSILSLEGNNLIELPSEIGKLTNLKRLFLMNNALIKVPAEIGSLVNLAELSFYKNSLTSLPSEIIKLNKLSFLDLGENYLNTLPREIGNLTNLTILGLRDNELKSLPSSFGKLTKLSELSLGGNKFRRKLDELGVMSNLTTLYLDFELLELNSDQIVKLKKLTSLYLNGTKISTLPNKISELASLNILYLIGDSLITIPYQIAGLTNLRELHLNIDTMNQLPSDIGNLIHLKRLDLMDTQIKSIPIELFNLNLADEDFFEIAQKLYKAKNYAQALNSFLKSIEIDSTKSYVYGNVGLCYRMLGKPENALKYLNKYLNTDENNTWCLNQLSYTYAAMNNVPKAFEYAGKSNNIRINPDVWFETGNQFYEVKNYQQALTSYLTSIEIDSAKTNVIVYGNVGSCYGKLHKPQEALEYYKTAYSMVKNLTLIDSNNYINWYNLSFYSLFVGRNTEAIEAALRSLELKRDQTGVNTNLALGYLMDNQFDKAKQLYLEWKDRKFPDDRYANVLFLQDIQDLEDANISHPDFKKVRELINQKN
jgi:Leucine-rich repeat (LRR) protein